MGATKIFTRTDLSIPVVECTRNGSGDVVIPPHVIPPSDTVVRFTVVGNATSIRSFDFSRWYGVGIDAVTYACQRQIERFLMTHDGDRTIASIVSYARCSGNFLDYLALLAVAENRTVTLSAINRELIDGFLDFLNDGKRPITSQKSIYDNAKSVLIALGKRGLIAITGNGMDNATFPRNPFPNSGRAVKGAAPLPKAQRKAFTQAVKTAVMPLFPENAETTSELLAYALLVVALHTGRNTTPLLEMSIDCLRPHPKDNVQFLVLFKRRGNSTSKVPLRGGTAEVSTPSVLPTVVRLIRRVVELTATLRSEAPDHLKERLWIYRTRVGTVSALDQSSLGKAATTLVEQHGLTDTDGKPQKINVSRLRKTFANRIYEILDGDLATTAIALGNSVRVAAVHYMRPGENASKNWKFMGLALTKELLSATIGASEKTPTGRCTDTKQGEYAPKNGATCMNFLDCLRCRNYVVTGDDLYRLFSFYWLIVRERDHIKRRKWQRHYAHILRLIDRDVVAAGVRKKLFAQHDVDVARDRARTDPHPYWAAANVLEGLSS